MTGTPGPASVLSPSPWPFSGRFQVCVFQDLHPQAPELFLNKQGFFLMILIETCSGLGHLWPAACNSLSAFFPNIPSAWDALPILSLSGGCLPFIGLTSSRESSLFA